MRVAPSLAATRTAVLLPIAPEILIVDLNRRERGWNRRAGEDAVDRRIR